MLPVIFMALSRRLTTTEIMLKIKNLTKSFVMKKRSIFGKRLLITAVDHVNLEINKDETFGIVGESGCGKTTLSRLILRLIKADSGQIFFNDTDINSLNNRQIKEFRKNAQMIFQDPYTSLDPVKSIYDIIAEPLKVHGVSRNTSKLKTMVLEILENVGLPASQDFLQNNPRELSGGQRQRVGIARSLVLHPKFIVADEPISMLDASVKAEIISLMLKLKTIQELTYVFVTHEMSVAYCICDRIGVMYAGKILELGPTEEVIKKPLHPYTDLLVRSVPPLYPDEAWGKSILEGEVPYQTEISAGCRFHQRCNDVKDICRVRAPDFKEVKTAHYTACHNT